MSKRPPVMPLAVAFVFAGLIAVWLYSAWLMSQLYGN